MSPPKKVPKPKSNVQKGPRVSMNKSGMPKGMPDHPIQGQNPPKGAPHHSIIGENVPGTPGS